MQAAATVHCRARRKIRRRGITIKHYLYLHPVIFMLLLLLQDIM